MSDIAPDVAPAPAPAPAPVNPLETPAPAPAPAPEAADPFDNEQVQQFDRKYVEKIRTEAAERRVASKKYEDAFSKYNEQEQAVWFELAQELVTDPKSAATKFQQIAAEILGAPAEPAVPVAPVADPAGEKPLTQADIDRILAERDSKSQQERDLAAATSKVVSEAEALGYKQGSAEWRELMFLARYEADGDLTKAHGMRDARSKAAVDAYLAQKAGQGGIPVSKGGGDVPSEAHAPATFGAASEALRTRLENM